MIFKNHNLLYYNLIITQHWNYFYTPQKAEDKNKRPRKNGSKTKEDSTQSIASGYNYCTQTHNENLRFPKNLLTYNNRKGELNSTKRLHPTQKPVELLEWLIKTYSNEGEVVLDNCAGSMSTAIACLNTNRNGIMIEKDEHYFEVGCKRIKQHILDNNINLYYNQVRGGVIWQNLKIG